MSFSLTTNYFSCAICKHTATDAVDSANGLLCASCGHPGLPPSYFVRSFMSANSGSCECGWEGTLAFKGLHERTECPSRKVACKGCGISVPLYTLQVHLDTCPQVVTCCDICHFEGERQLLPNHTRTCDFGCAEKFPCSETRAHGISCMDIHDNVHRILLREHALLKKQRIEEHLVPTFTPPLISPEAFSPNAFSPAPTKQLRVNYSLANLATELQQAEHKTRRRNVANKILEKFDHKTHGLKKEESVLCIAVLIPPILNKEDIDRTSTKRLLQIFSKCYDYDNDRKCKKQLNDSALQLLPCIGNLDETILTESRFLICEIAGKIIGQSMSVIENLTVSGSRNQSFIAELSAGVKTGLQILLKLAEQQDRIINESEFFDAMDRIWDAEYHNRELITDNFSVLAGIVKRCTSFDICHDLVKYLAEINPRMFKRQGLVDHLVRVDKNAHGRDTKSKVNKILNKFFSS